MHPPEDSLLYNIEYLRLCVLEDEDTGLAAWEEAMAAYRDSYLLAECRQLLAVAKSWSLAPAGQARVQEQEGVLALQANDWDRAQSVFLALLPMYQKLGERHGQARTVGHLGVLAAREGNINDINEAEQNMVKAISLWTELDHQDGIAANLMNLGEIYRNRGAWDESVAYFEQALAIVREVGDHKREASIFKHLARFISSRMIGARPLFFINVASICTAIWVTSTTWPQLYKMRQSLITGKGAGRPRRTSSSKR